MGDFTLERKRDYVASGGVHCPGCRSGNLVAGDLTVTAGMVYQDVRCFGCGISFTDVYHLAGVETEEFTDPESAAADGPGELDAACSSTATPGAAGTRPQVRREAQPT